MAIKLTQEADSTIVTAATRAGLATSPKDYSSIFDSVSESYAKSTEASAEAWGQIAGTIAVVGAELQKNAEVYSDTAQRVYDAGGTEELVDGIYDIKDELSALGPFGGKFGDRETRRKRSEILARRNKLFAEVDGWGESLEEASLAAKNNLLDYSLMGGDVEFVNAIIASNTSNKTTSEGNEARISRDPKTGELMYTLHDMNSGGAAIPGKTMSLSSFKTLIQDSAKDVDNVTGTFLSGVTDGAENMGATYGGTMDEYHKNKLLDSLDSMTSNAATLKRGMRTKFSGTSFYDELTGPNQTELSSKYFTLMLQDIANVKDGEIKADALGDVKDTDGSGGISQQEINDQYVLFQNSILTGEGPMAKKLFTDFVMNKAETAYNFGAKQKAKGTPSGNDDDKSTGFLTTRESIYNGSIKRYMKYNEAKNLYDGFKPSTEGKDTYAIVDNVKYEYSAKDNNWYYGEGDDKIDYGTPFEFLESMNISDPDFLSLTTSTDDQKTAGTPIKTKTEQDKVNIVSVAEDFMKTESTFTTDIKQKYDFSNYIIQDRQFEILPGELPSNEVRIIDRNNPKNYFDFRTNYSKANNAQKAAIKWDEWIKKQGIELNTNKASSVPSATTIIDIEEI